MRLFIILLALYIAVRGQSLNSVCTSDTDCINGTSPCTNSNCICDPLILRCRLALDVACTNGNQCNTNTICSNHVCRAPDSKPCSADTDCLTNGVCLSGFCRASLGYAWDIVNNVYAACHSSCATCFRPADNTSCLNCTDAAKYAFAGLCVCTEGAADSTGTCQACDSTCATCALPASPFACTSCPLSSMTLISGICFCPAGTAWDSATLSCESCDSSCLTCSRPGSASYCTSCTVGAPLNGVCGGTTTCTDGTAPGDTGCEACDSSCKTCLAPADPNRCTGCCSGYTLIGGSCMLGHTHTPRCKMCSSKLMIEINGICKCKQGYIGDSTDVSVSDTYCLPCDSSCQTCYAANNPNACTSCTCGLFLTASGTCSTSSGGSTNVTGCASDCKSCIVAGDATECLSCLATGATQLNGFCYCPSNFYSTGGACVSPCQAPCAECYIHDPYICTACSNGMVPLGGTCLCPNGTALAVNGSCLACDISCATCANATSPAACLTCTDTRIVPDNGLCVCPGLMVINSTTGICECPSGYTELDMTCFISSCGPGTFYNGTDCVSCGMTGCLNCTSATVCNECQPGYFLNSNNVCIACPTNCPTCSSATVCTSCVPGYNLNSAGACVKACPACCPTCSYSSTGVVTCLTCLRGFAFKGSQCLACSVGIPNCISCIGCGCVRCRPGYYKNAAGQCVSCASAIPNCQLCVNASLCYQCTPPYFFNVTTKSCSLTSPTPVPPSPPCPVKPCPEGSYRGKDGKCYRCHCSCQSCSGSGNYGCTKCGPNAAFKRWGTGGGMCVCATGYSLDSSRRGCYRQSTMSKP